MEEDIRELLIALDALDELLTRLNWVLRNKPGQYKFLRRIRKRLAVLLPEENDETE